MVIGVWILSSTFYEHQKRKFAETGACWLIFYKLNILSYFISDNPNPFFCAFSLYTTLRNLHKPYPEDWPVGVDGMRAIALAFVILHNTFEFSTGLNDSKNGSVSFFV